MPANSNAKTGTGTGTDARQAHMTIDLGEEQVMLERLRCSEALGEPFYMTIDVLSTLGDVDLLPHLGKTVAVHLYEDDALMRHFHGVITDGEFLYESDFALHYRLVARPFTHFLSHNREMAIFQDKTVPDIIGMVFDAAGLSNSYKFKTTGKYVPRTYCVQYRESDFGFLTRLMEEEGIYYYYEHSADKHIMILCDAPTAHGPATPAKLPYSKTSAAVYNVGSGKRRDHEHTLESIGERVSSGGEATVTLGSFNFQKPDRPLQAHADAPAPLQHPGDVGKVYDYQGSYIDEGGQGTDLSAVRLGALRRERQIYVGRSQATSLACGRKVAVSGHDTTPRFNQDYLITRTYHSMQAEQYKGGHDDPNETDEDNHCTFEAIPAGTTFHMPAVTPRPVVQGLESAIVSGPDDEEIWTEKYGRVKVRFHWDRSGTVGENSTCWVRVAQYAGLGSLFLPRINQEVMVDFLYGDPDQPIVVGWVFNESHLPIYDLPKNKTISTIRTKSYPHGQSVAYDDAKILDTKSPGANEIRFEDKSSEEELFVHAEKDMNQRVRNDQTNYVGHNQYEKIYWDRDAFVGRDEVTVVKRNQTLTVKEGDQTMTVHGNQKEDIETGNREITIKMGNDALTVKMGNITIKASLGKIEIEAMQSIELKCGPSKIKMDPMSISMEAMMVKTEGKIMYETKGLMSQQEGSAMHIVKGGLVMIN